MKRLTIMILAVFLMAATAYAGPDKQQRDNAANLTYSHLHSVAVHSLPSTSKGLTPTDSTSTDTFSTSYFPAGTPLPCKIVINGSSSQLVYAAPYEIDESGELIVPTATCAYLPWDSNAQITKTFIGIPNLALAVSAASTFTVEIWTLP